MEEKGCSTMTYAEFKKMHIDLTALGDRKSVV